MVAAVQTQLASGRSFENRYRIGVMVGSAAILMMFTALTSAYIVRAASANDWRPLAIVPVLFLSTAVIIISSGTLEIARRRLKANSPYRTWLFVTVVLGFGFLGTQLVAWRQLAAQGIYVSSNPHSSFFYVLTATHGIHLLGGLIALVFLTLRTRAFKEDRGAISRSQDAAGAVALYWHFMDLLWIYLFVLLFFWK